MDEARGADQWITKRKETFGWESDEWKWNIRASTAIL